VAPVTGGTRGARYLSQLLERERHAGMVLAAGSLWARSGSACDTCPRLRLPAVQVDLALAWPDALRLRADSWFGTAFDLGLSGDSLTAYVPSRDAGVALAAGGDSPGLGHPGALAVRAVCAAWRPPDAAWDAGTWAGDLLVLRWVEGEDSLGLAVDAAGRPAWARLWRAAGDGVRIDYQRWAHTEGVDWPVLVRAREREAGVELTARLDRVRFAPRADRARLAVRLPEGAERLDPGRLGGLLRRLGGGR
jgi:hypothetical protein